MKRFFYLLIWGIIVVVAFSQCCNVTGKKAKYVFYFIGDGMGINQVNATEMYLAEKEGRIGIKPLNFSQFPVTNYATTYSVYNSVTCSAAAGTALASGIKTRNGTIGMDSLRQSSLFSIAEKAKKNGKKVGITTSVGVNHATPAAFYAHQPNRNMYYEIAIDLSRAGFDLYAGSGLLTSGNQKNTDVFSMLRDSGYIVVRGHDEFVVKTKDAAKVVFIQQEDMSSESLPYAIDREENALTLAQITEDAIDFLTRDTDKGFFLMVEGGKIDWACHNNDAATVFDEVVDFSLAIQKALDFYQKHPDETLIVVTADHETGNIALGLDKYELNLQALQYQKCSKDELTRKIQKLRDEKQNRVSWEDVQRILAENLGFWNTIQLSEKQEKQLKEVYEETFQGKEIKLEENLYSKNELLAGKAIQILNHIAMIGWGNSGHSAGIVPVFAIGVGSQLFQGKLDNTDIPKKIVEAAGYCD